MAPLPKTALLQSRLTNLTAGPAVPESGHVVIQVQFVDFDGQSKKAFFKRLDSTYPKILAMMSVATSIIMRSLLGERAAEDRLVYDDNGEITGTLSIAIEGFKPFHFGSEGVPEDPQEKEIATPSHTTLMQHNIIELLFFSWFLGDDDLHPKNMGLKGRIDYDMFFYNITKIIKGPRTVGGSFNNALNITVRDFFNFPILTDSTPTHWPTRQIPDNYYYPKRYTNYDQFMALAGNPAYLDPVTGKTTTAQKQLFTAVLKALLTYQPDVLKKRLKDALGNEPLNYKALSVLQQTQLEESNPDLFNTSNNDKPFVEFMTNLYHKYYDELYRKLVFSQGCEKNAAGVSVPAFNKFLHDYPSAYQGVKEWIDKQNSLLNEKQNLCRAQIQRGMADRTEINIACAEPLEKAIQTVSDSRKLAKDDLLRRYHQVWRDSFTLQIKNILNKSRRLSQDLQVRLSLSKTSTYPLSETHHEDPRITQAWQILSEFQEDSPEKVQGRLDCGKDNDLRNGLLQLVLVHQQIYEITSDYFQKEVKNITNFDNNQYIDKLQKLRDAYVTIITLLGESTSWGKDCCIIASELNRFCNSALFAVHLYEQDETIQSMMPVRAITRPHTDNEVIQDGLNALFNWAAQLPARELTSKISNIIDLKYVGGLRRAREHPVKTYLIESETSTSGDDRLAFILTSGKVINGHLNTLLVENLIQEMVFSTQSDINVFLPSVRTAFEDHTFNTDFYTKNAFYYAKNNDRFHHIYSKNFTQSINKAMYQWVADMPKSKFRDYIDLVLSEYKSKSNKLPHFVRFSFFPAADDRCAEVEGYFKQMDSNPKILASIFKQGGLLDNSLNTLLFKLLISTMQKDILKDNDKFQQKEYKLILQVVGDELENYFLNTITPYAQNVDTREFQKSDAAHELVA